MSVQQENVFVGLDIGTTKICAVVIRGNPDGTSDVIGVGTAPSYGLRKGVIVNIDTTVQSIQKAIKDAERMSGITIKSVCAGIAGGHIKSMNSRGVIAVKGKEVTEKDIERVIESASAVNIPVGHEVLHVLTQQFILDGQSEINDPLGMCGVRLEVEVHIVIGAVSSAVNIAKACEKAGISVDDICLEQLASGQAVLSDDEREIGVALIDGGGGTTDMAVFTKNSIYDTVVLQIGGNNFTRDLSIGLNTPEAEAERIKCAQGHVWLEDVDSEAVIEIASVGGRAPRHVTLSVVSQILQARADEIFQMLIGELVKKNLLENLGAGIVVTGGLSNLIGTEHLAHSISGVPVRVGTPIGIGGLVDTVNNPIFATGVGLALLHSKSDHSGNKISKGSEEKVFTSLIDRMKSWFGEFFK